MEGPTPAMESPGRCVFVRTLLWPNDFRGVVEGTVGLATLKSWCRSRLPLSRCLSEVRGLCHMRGVCENRLRLHLADGRSSRGEQISR